MSCAVDDFGLSFSYSGYIIDFVLYQFPKLVVEPVSFLGVVAPNQYALMSIAFSGLAFSSYFHILGV